MEVDRLSRKRPGSSSQELSEEVPKKKHKRKYSSYSLSSGSESTIKTVKREPKQVQQTPAGEPSNPAKTKRSYSRKEVLKPKAGSWLTHIASSVINILVQQAIQNGIDPRDHLEHLDWSVWAPNVLSPEELHNLWFFINKEYPTSVSLSDIQSVLQPYARVTPETILKEECREKYKDQFPKPPVSSYLLFCRGKHAKLRMKHPELSPREEAVLLGKKWRSMGPDRQEKYKQQYKLLKERYKEDLENFYIAHPDARPTKPKPKPKSKKKNKAPSKKRPPSVENASFTQLKKVFPKRPGSAYIVFCKTKRAQYRMRYPELSPTELTTKLGKKWKAMEEQKKLKYREIFEQEMSQYKRDIVTFYDTHPEAKMLLSKKPSNKKKSLTGKEVPESEPIKGTEDEQEEEDKQEEEDEQEDEDSQEKDSEQEEDKNYPLTRVSRPSKEDSSDSESSDSSSGDSS